MTLLAQELIELALKSGASHAEVYQSQSHSQPVFFEANRLKQLESSQATGCALRLWRDERPGLAVAYGLVEPQVLVDKALAMTKLNEQEIIELSGAQTLIFPNRGSKLEPEYLIGIGKNSISQIRGAYPDAICSAELECETETTLLVNSQGLHCEYSETSVSYSVGVEWIRGEDFLGVYDGEETKTQLQWERVVGQILKRLDWAKYNAPSPLGKVPVLFTGNAATMLWNTVSSALSAKRVLERSSPWNESIGELVVSELLNLSQQPDKEPYNCPFDDEGTPTQYINLIDRGRLIQFYGDRTTGRILGTGTTGNGFRPSLGHYPSPGLVNLAIAPGNLSFTEAIATLEEGIIVDQMLGGGADISGDFSVNIDLGYLVKRGEIVGRVKDTMIAGNVYHALKEVIALLSDTQWNGSYYTPSLIVDGLSVIS